MHPLPPNKPTVLSLEAWKPTPIRRACAKQHAQDVLRSALGFVHPWQHGKAFFVLREETLALPGISGGHHEASQRGGGPLRMWDVRALPLAALFILCPAPVLAFTTWQLQHRQISATVLYGGAVQYDLPVLHGQGTPWYAA